MTDRAAIIGRITAAIVAAGPAADAGPIANTKVGLMAVSARHTPKVKVTPAARLIADL